MRVGIAGVSGYAGVELLRLLHRHPAVRITALSAGRGAGRALSDLWPGWTGAALPPVGRLDVDHLAEHCDVVFLALPHGVSQTVVPALLERGVDVVDLGADHRLTDPEAYAAAYGAPHTCPELLSLATYGLPEQNRDVLAGARLVACPGCYPTATAIAALPLVEEGLADLVFSDCLSGISGAGRKAGPRNLYAEVQESVTAYGLAGAHRHTPEMEQALGVPVVFSPHLVPMVRGMLATVKVRLRRPVSGEELRDLYRERYARHPAVVVRDEVPATRDVRGTAAAHVFPLVDIRREVATVVSAIDNLGKGAAGQAVHAFNLSRGLPETAGLPLVPLLP
ncbi:MAG: N-acetyl-gamma-glutamyl-phosphate reductase [Deltaproteobacteria bacterium]|nr:MAG: N-acetyl-gamma-glutamyl-phosphate reductase [Deltaproteobacteria bacterium]